MISPIYSSVVNVDSFIQIQHNVRPDSNLILSAAQEVAKEAGFDDLLDNVRNRIDEIESLHRTRELTVCCVLHVLFCFT